MGCCSPGKVRHLLPLVPQLLTIAPFDSRGGYSHLKISQEFDRLDVSLRYVDTTSTDAQKEAILRFGTANQVLHKLIIETPEVNFEKAIRHTSQIVADILDAISFLKRLPLSVRSILAHADGEKFIREYRTFSYSPRELMPEDIDQATTIPASIKPVLRLFREGTSSTRPPYRLLCLYRVRELIMRVRQDNDKKVLQVQGHQTDLTDFYWTTI